MNRPLFFSDMNECNEWGYCEQVCINTMGSFICSCVADYSFVAPKHCRARNSKTFDIISLFLYLFFHIYLFAVELCFYVSTWTESIYKNCKCNILSEIKKAWNKYLCRFLNFVDHCFLHILKHNLISYIFIKYLCYK